MGQLNDDFVLFSRRSLEREKMKGERRRVGKEEKAKNMREKVEVLAENGFGCQSVGPFGAMFAGRTGFRFGRERNVLIWVTEFS